MKRSVESFINYVYNNDDTAEEGIIDIFHKNKSNDSIQNNKKISESEFRISLLPKFKKAFKESIKISNSIIMNHKNNRFFNKNGFNVNKFDIKKIRYEEIYLSRSKKNIPAIIIPLIDWNIFDIYPTIEDIKYNDMIWKDFSKIDRDLTDEIQRKIQNIDTNFIFNNCCDWDSGSYEIVYPCIYDGTSIERYI